MREPNLSATNPDDYIDCYDSLTEYVLIYAEKTDPLNEWNYQGHIYSATYEAFNRKFLQKEIDKSFLDRYEGDEELLDMITTLGYDVEKFWYLLLFIYDYSYCACKKETEYFKSAYEYLEDIYNNVGEEGAELTIKVKGEKKVAITEHLTLDLIKNTVKEIMDIGDGKYLKSKYPEYYTFNIVKKNSDSYTIWFFAKTFLKFFKIIPPKNIRRKKDQINTYGKKLLISKLVYLVKLSYNENFTISESSLNGFLNQYKNEPGPGLIIDYL